jgi:hypothetical protein
MLLGDGSSKSGATLHLLQFQMAITIILLGLMPIGWCASTIYSWKYEPRTTGNQRGRGQWRALAVPASPVAPGRMYGVLGAYMYIRMPRGRSSAKVVPNVLLHSGTCVPASTWRQCLPVQVHLAALPPKRLACGKVVRRCSNAFAGSILIDCALCTLEDRRCLCAKYLPYCRSVLARK